MEKVEILKFSIIIPVYNTGKYIKTCLDSVLNQDITIEQYEVILINDGSTDNSAIICEEYKRKFDNVIFLSQENMGQSVARNHGLEVASGKYIIFVDSDDYIQNNSLSMIFQEMENRSLDALAVNFACHTPQNDLISISKQGRFEEKEIISGNNYIIKNGFDISVTAWSYIYKREFLLNEKICFVEDLFHEDCEWTAHWFPICNNIGYLNVVFYHYIVSEISTMRSKNIKKCFDLIEISQLIHKHAEINKEKGNMEVFYALRNYAGFEIWSALRSCVQQGYRIKELIDEKNTRKRIVKYGYPNKRYRFLLFFIWIKAYRMAEVIIKLIIRIKPHKQ